ncbi:hypothetical protein [Jiella avicenniae]|uniref:Uncharacterized protein n=1 Tax=Jiella avicenniae TaxID=2907202 RepID=A0A9X1T4D6_9HYPH|nr:hypothetical protein [Jiella avicenniae]MCE7028436.1 hypothetical protein [Jiella avicenniae]
MMVPFTDAAFIAETARDLGHCVVTGSQISEVMKDPDVASAPTFDDLDVVMRRPKIVKATIRLFGGDVSTADAVYGRVWINVRNVANGRPRIERFAETGMIEAAE